MMNYKSIRFLALLLAATFAFSSCEDDPKLPDNKLQFEAPMAGIGPEQGSLTVNIGLSRAASKEVTVILAINPGTLAYGVDFTTLPAASANQVTLTIPKGETSTTLTLVKVEGVGFTGDETIVFEVISVDGSPVIGENSKITVTFSEISVADAIMNVGVGGPTHPNRVFLDLSANRQTAINRDNWDLGFYTAAGEFKVILNNSVTMLARPLDKTDLNTVTTADTTGMGESFNTSAFDPANTPFMDKPNGDLETTAFGTVSATATENKVYIVNTGVSPAGTARTWKKVRVLRNATTGGYTVQHANINATTFQTLEVTKDDTYSFVYASLQTNSVVSVEPAKDKWDIAYTTFLNQFPLGPSVIPYSFNDFIIQNREGVQTAQVIGTYDDFDAEDLAGITFNAAQNNIGSGWRVGGSETTPPTLRTDRFYLIKDAEGNVYKLKFTSLTTNGERGRPSLEYKRIQEAA